MTFREFSEKWSALHGGVAVKGIVKGWLKISYWVAGFTTHASIITFLGLIFGAFTFVFAGEWRGVLYLVLSLIADGLDGSVAIRHGRESRFGAVLDAVVDRIVEVFWALAFIKLGAPVAIVAAAWLAASVQEYLRARFGGVGVADGLRITIAERPVRASLLFIAMVRDLLHISIFSPIVFIWLAMQVYSLISVARDGYARLR
mgnify:CR=1 FL=1